MAEPTKLERLVAEFNAWEQMVTTGLDAAGERVIVDGRMVPDLRRQMLAGIGQAYVEAAARPRAPEGARVTRYTLVVWERGDWGHEEIHVEEARQRDGSILWAIRDGFGCWTRSRDGFVLESQPSSRTDEWLREARWTLEEALAEAPLAAAHKLQRMANRLAKYDAEQAKKAGKSDEAQDR